MEIRAGSATAGAATVLGASGLGAECEESGADVPGAAVPSWLATVVAPANEPVSPTHKSKPMVAHLTQTAPTSANGCGGNPTEAPDCGLEQLIAEA